MIRTITVQGYKSFHAATPVAIPIETATQKPVFFYGLNGAGKTAIGEVTQYRVFRTTSSMTSHRSSAMNSSSRLVGRRFVK